jgi:hypothetical protein
LLPAAFLEQACAEAGARRNNSLYAPLVVLWPLVLQRLEGGAPLGAAVLELRRGLPPEFWPGPCKRIRDWWERGKAPSSHTGAYNQARQALPVEVGRQCCDRIFQGLVAHLNPSAISGSAGSLTASGPLSSSMLIRSGRVLAAQPGRMRHSHRRSVQQKGTRQRFDGGDRALAG